MTVNVSKNDIGRLVSISRSFKWHNEHMKVLFTNVDHVPALASREAIQDGCTPAKTPTPTLPNKRAHVPSSTQQRLIKTKLEDAFMSGRDESAAYASVTNESDDMYAIGCMESLDLQTPFDTYVAIVPGDIIKAPRLVRGVASGSEKSVRIVQAATSGWVVARIGLPGAKVRRATRDGAEGWIVEQAARCKDKWIWRIRQHSWCEEILLPLIPANCCTALIRRGNAGSWKQLVCCAVTPWRVVQNSRGDSLQQF